jgi:hypothetical protein
MGYRGNDRFATDPTGMLAAGAPGGGPAGSGIGGSGFSVGRVGIPMADVSRAPGTMTGTGFGGRFSTSFGGTGGSGTVDVRKNPGGAGSVKKSAKGGKLKMAKGGSTASKRADGCATKGKTKGRFV